MSPVSVALRRARPGAPAAGRVHVRAHRSRRARAVLRARPRRSSRCSPAPVRRGRPPLTGPLVTATPSEPSPLAAGGELHRVARRRGARRPSAPATPPGGANTLLFALLRHALLRAYAATAVRIARARGVAEPGEGAEPGSGCRPRRRPWTRLAAPLPGSPAGATLAQHLDAVRAVGHRRRLTGRRAADRAASSSRRACASSPACPRRGWRGCAAGELDLASHRLDAWISAHAGRRLAALRDARPRRRAARRLRRRRGRAPGAGAARDCARLHPRAVARPGGHRRGPAFRPPGPRGEAGQPVRGRSLVAARAAGAARCSTASAPGSPSPRCSATASSAACTRTIRRSRSTATSRRCAASRRSTR